MVAVRVIDTGDLRRLTRALKQQQDGRELRLVLTRGLREILAPILAEVKASYGSGKHLRPLLKRAARIEVKTAGRDIGARLRVDGREMPDHTKSIAAYVEGDKARWRHPVFGDTEVWVAQTTPRGRFYEITGGHEESAAHRVEELT